MSTRQDFQLVRNSNSLEISMYRKQTQTGVSTTLVLGSDGYLVCIQQPLRGKTAVHIMLICCVSAVRVMYTVKELYDNCALAVALSNSKKH